MNPDATPSTILSIISPSVSSPESSTVVGREDKAGYWIIFNEGWELALVTSVFLYMFCLPLFYEDICLVNFAIKVGFTLETIISLWVFLFLRLILHSRLSYTNFKWFRLSNIEVVSKIPVKLNFWKPYEDSKELSHSALAVP